MKRDQASASSKRGLNSCKIQYELDSGKLALLDVKGRFSVPNDQYSMAISALMMCLDELQAAIKTLDVAPDFVNNTAFKTKLMILKNENPMLLDAMSSTALNLYYLNNYQQIYDDYFAKAN